MHQALRDLLKITFEFLNRTYLPREWGSQERFVKNRQTSDENLLYAKCFNRILYHYTATNPAKIKEIKTVPYYKHKLMRPSIGIVNLQKV